MQDFDDVLRQVKDINSKRRAKVIRTRRDEVLSSLDIEVLTLLSQGLSNKLIAKRLNRTSNNISYRIIRCKQALDAETTPQLIYIATIKGYIH